MALNRRQRRANKKSTPQSSPEIEAVLNAALAHQQKGEYADSERMIRRVLSIAPGNPDALHLQGVLAYQTGNFPLALECLAAATRAAPKAGNIWASLALVQDAAGQKEQAEKTYRKAQRLAPKNAEIRNNLGVLLSSLGQQDNAIRQFKDAAKLDPSYIQALVNLASTHFRLGQLEEAETVYRRAIALEPDNLDLSTDLAVILQNAGKIAEAEDLFQAALSENPENVPALINLASLHFKNAEYEKGETVARKAVGLMPDHPAAQNNLGNNLLGQQRYTDAEDAFRKAIDLVPTDPEAHGNLGHLQMRICAPDNAEQSFRTAMDLAQAQDRDGSRHTFGLSLALFAQGGLGDGNLEEAWMHHESGFDCGERQPDRRTAAKPWKGEPLEGKTLLVWPEQGIGDEIRFAECLPDFIEAQSVALAEHGHLVIECDKRLVVAFTRSFAQHGSIAVKPAFSTDMTKVDFQISFGQLAANLRPTLGALGNKRSFLTADPGLCEKWQDRFNALGAKPKIGISWRSGLASARRSETLSDLDAWRDLIETLPAEFVTLQYGDSGAEIERLKTLTGKSLHQWPDLDLKDDIEDVFAMLSTLDAVITAPTSLMDMAGAVGARTFTIMPEREWVMLGTTRHPWYRSIEVMTRRLDEEWTQPLAAITRCLTADVPEQAEY